MHASWNGNKDTTLQSEQYTAPAASYILLHPSE